MKAKNGFGNIHDIIRISVMDFILSKAIDTVQIAVSGKLPANIKRIVRLNLLCAFLCLCV